MEANACFEEMSTFKVMGMSSAVLKRIVALGVIGLLGAVSPAVADCFEEAALRHQVNPYILRAIAKTESSFNPDAINKNTNNSIDYGFMQINSIHAKELAKYGITQKDLMDPCISVHVGAWLLARHMRTYGNTWDAIGAYKSKTDGIRQSYAATVYSNLQKILSGDGK